MTVNFQIRVFGLGTENFKKYSVHCKLPSAIYVGPSFPHTNVILIYYTRNIPL